jgi:rubrerythrin
MAFCSNCGSKLRDGDSFCTGCGTKIKWVSPAPSASSREVRSEAGAGGAGSVSVDEMADAVKRFASAGVSAGKQFGINLGNELGASGMAFIKQASDALEDTTRKLEEKAAQVGVVERMADVAVPVDEPARETADSIGPAPKHAEGSGAGLARDVAGSASALRCPACGEIVAKLDMVCPTCGYKLRDSADGSIKELSLKLEAIDKEHPALLSAGPLRKQIAREKADLIRNFPIPSSSDDLYEFMVIASSNCESGLSNDSKGSEPASIIASAWRAKFDQAYAKAMGMGASPSQMERYRELKVMVEDRARREKLRNWLPIVVLLALTVLPLICLSLRSCMYSY